MTGTKKKLWIAVVMMLALCSVFAFAGCEDKDENKKYDVTIKIKNNYGSEWIFTPDIQELTYEFEYTGEEMTFYIDSYNLPDHPEWSDKWFTPKGSGADVFHKTMTYRPPNGLNKSFNGPVKEIGEYNICIEADSTSDLWNFRAVYLNIKVI